MITKSTTTLLILICAAVLLNAAGCVFVGHDHYDRHGHYYPVHHDDAVIVHVHP